MSKIKLLNFFGVALILIVLSSCNASLKKASKNSVALPKECVLLNKYCLNTYFDANSYGNLYSTKMHSEDKERFDIYKNEIVDECSKMFDRSMSNVWGKNTSRIPSGYVICTIKSGKMSNKLWGLAPMILTCGNYVLMGGPVGHTNYKREYVFDVYDNSGNLIKTYTIEGKKNQIKSLVTTSQQSSIELQAFKSALKKFQKLYFNDYSSIEASISRNNKKIESDMHDEDREERIVTMCSWIDSNVLPSDEELQQAITVAPEDFVGWGLLIEKNLSDQRYYEALQNVDKYIELNPTCNIIHPYLKKAVICKLLTRDTEAMKNAFTAFQLEPDYLPARSLLVSLLIEEGCFSDALKYVDEELANNPGNIDYLQIQKDLNNYIAQSKENIKKDKEAEQLRQAMAMSAMADANRVFAQSITNITNLKNPSQPANNAQYIPQNRSSQISAKEKECSMCKGKGWIVSFDTPTFDSSTSRYCDECHREVYASHSHKTCPSCKGRKVVTTL